MPRKKTVEKITMEALQSLEKCHQINSEKIAASLALSNSYWERTNSALQMIVREIKEIKREPAPGNPRDSINIGRVLNALLDQLDKPEVKDDEGY